ncbi:amidase [Piscinibacter sp. XHJ-5]|uniref:amidase n=1 Tax=Piscinibacter sp. XHJ-5 TaxID=3037797 RepID=UPI0024532794|nr:amidase [Piscinibacter sp. XHJ-5]
MDRRVFVRLLAPLALLGGNRTLAQPRSPSAGPRSGDRFPWLEASVAQLQEAMQRGATSARSLTAAYLERIRMLDRSGPQLRSVIELNPDALAIAAALDDERRARRVRGPLHGIPLLLKDNIATADRMSTSAGSLVLQGVRPPRDAHLVARLRDAGAVILGKTNLSEWANIRSTRSTSGWSARGGLTRNPYALDRNTSGSSSGSAAAIAANLAAIAVGTETDGSIVSPSSINGLVGLKPTVGLVSRDGIVPISHTQDTAGPMTRCVADAAALLSAIAGPDPRDAATARAERVDYTRSLDARRLAGARLGVVRNQFGGNDRVSAVIDASLAMLKAQGAVLVDPVELKNTEKYGDAELEVLLFELKAGLARYLAEFARDAPVRTLADVIAWNEQHRAQEMPWFGQELFERAQAKGGLDSKEYLDALAACARYSRAEGIDAVLAEHKLDALVAPTGGPAWLTDPINGDHYGGSFSTPAAVAGYPHLTVPAGFVHGLPVGLSFVGPPYSEPLLIGLGYAFEQATRARRPPSFARTASLS